MDKWEYLYEVSPDFGEDFAENTTEWLNAKGRDGWEAVETEVDGMGLWVLFKRRIEVPSVVIKKRVINLCAETDGGD